MEPPEDYSVHYRTWHNESREHVALMRAYHRSQLDPLLAGVRGGPAVDLGCGMGFAVLALRDLGFDAVGVERDAEQVAACRRLGVPVETADVREYLAERPHELAVVTLLDFLEHLPPAEHIPVMRDVRKALRPGGVAILTVPNALSVVMAYHRYIDHTHQTAFTTHSLRYVLLNAGFRDIEFQMSPLARRPPLRLWKRAARQDFRAWVVRKLWREMLMAELPDKREARETPIDLNLTVRAIP